MDFPPTWDRARQEPERSQPRRQSPGMRGLRIAVLAADALPLLAVILIRLALPPHSGEDGEAQFWAGLLLAYALTLLFGFALVLNVIYLIALGIMRRRYDNGYGPISRALLFLLPAAATLGLMIR
ncbi:hypothetical protein [Sinomonas humi]|uniref:Uncharacterized protein n=1 Tax=Sinomonas humi TaxID=1338436 RepID=A0A0B2ADD1_9MICC|nr:hypothetical protein [Sinomonas humi]KHL01599.1 hypothetical protein LK10_15235 [Sinomonas humi]